MQRSPVGRARQRRALAAGLGTALALVPATAALAGVLADPTATGLTRVESAPTPSPSPSPTPSGTGDPTYPDSQGQASEPSASSTGAPEPGTNERETEQDPDGGGDNLSGSVLAALDDLTLEVSSATATPDSTTQVRLTVDNSGPDEITADLSATLTLAGGFALRPADGCSTTGDTVTCEEQDLTLAPNETRSWDVTVGVPAGLNSGTYDGTAELVATRADGTSVTRTADFAVRVDPEAQEEANVSVALSPPEAKLTAGSGRVPVLAQVFNRGPAVRAQGQARLRLTLPAGVTVELDDQDCLQTVGQGTWECRPAEDIEVAGGDRAAYALTVYLTAASSAKSGQVRMAIAVPEGSDPDESDNTASITLTVTGGKAEPPEKPQQTTNPRPPPPTNSPSPRPTRTPAPLAYTGAGDTVKIASAGGAMAAVGGGLLLLPLVRGRRRRPGRYSRSAR